MDDNLNPNQPTAQDPAFGLRSTSNQAYAIPKEESGPDEHPAAAQPAPPTSLPTTAQPAAQMQTTSGLAIAGMVLGIVALATIPLPIINFGSPVLAIIGLVLSIVGFNGIKKGKKKGKGIAVAGIVLCAIVTVCALLVSAACSAAVSSKDSNSASSAASSAAASANAAASSDKESSNVGTGGSDAAKASKNGFDAATNSIAHAAGIAFEIPAYFGKPNSKDLYYAETGNATTMLQVSTMGKNIKGTNEEFESQKHGFAMSYIDGVGKAKNSSINEDSISVADTTVAGLPAATFSFTATLMGVPASSKGVMFFNESDESIGIIALTQSDASKYDYYSDFEKILDSAVGNDSATGKRAGSSSSVSASASSETASSDEVSPDLKEMLDSYEAFMDEYVEFMKEYKESDDATSMMGEYSNIMTRYADYMQKVEKLNTDSMSTADYAYYIDVTSRVSKKLLEAA